MIYLKLFLLSLIAVVAATLFYWINRKTKFKDLNYWVKQIIYGVVFGGIAIIGTEFGVNLGGAIANVRDAAPLTAGLLFGGPAGIIAGVIGGVERYVSVLWTGAYYSQIACSISTILAGVYAAFLRKVMFNGKRPSFILGFATGLVMEVIHLTIMFLTHLEDPEGAMEIVKIVTIPMTVFNGLSLSLSCLFVQINSYELKILPRKDQPLNEIIQRYLFLIVLVAYFTTTIFVYIVQTNSLDSEFESLLQVNLEDVRDDILQKSDENILHVCELARKEYNLKNYKASNFASDAEFTAALQEIANNENIKVSEINIVSYDKVIVGSTNPDFVGFSMTSGQADEFNVLLDIDGPVEYVQSYGPISKDSDQYRKYAAYIIDEGYIQVGYDAERFQKDLAETINGITKYRRVGTNGYVIIADSYKNVVSDLETHYYDSLTKLSNLNINIDNLNSEGNTTTSLSIKKYTEDYNYSVVEEECLVRYLVTEGYYIIAVIPTAEAFASRDNMIYINSFMEIMVFAFLFIFVYWIINSYIVKKVENTNNSLKKISDGDLNEIVDIHSCKEFDILSSKINETVEALKGYIDAAEKRMEEELQFAKNIQFSSLPSVFPPYPKIGYFDIFASMHTAKEVGGDFYDFYLLGENKLAFQIADVSGKGIPAAMFMMKAKTTIKGLVETGLDVNDALTMANEQLCEGNDANMFVTAWLGVIDFMTGHISYCNAGHNPPLIYRKGEGYSYLNGRPGFVLAGMPGFKYKLQELKLNPGDKIFLYTDGVTEATDANSQLYGEDRLLTFLNNNQQLNVVDTLNSTLDNVNLFVGEAPQFDDITMLAIEFRGSTMEERVYDASIDSWPQVLEFIESKLEENDVPMKLIMSLDIACEEIFVNIAHYAYRDKKGLAYFGLDVHDNQIIIRFRDSGIPFNPLDKDDPDITLKAEDRNIGGLGIYMVKKMLDEVKYEYTNGENILTLMKKF